MGRILIIHPETMRFGAGDGKVWGLKQREMRREAGRKATGSRRKSGRKLEGV